MTANSWSTNNHQALIWLYEIRTDKYFISKISAKRFNLQQYLNLSGRIYSWIYKYYSLPQTVSGKICLERQMLHDCESWLWKNSMLKLHTIPACKAGFLKLFDIETCILHCTISMHVHRQIQSEKDGKEPELSSRLGL